MATIVLFFILGIAGLIVNANAWFIVPTFAIYVSFGVGGVLLLIQLLSLSIIKRTTKKYF